MCEEINKRRNAYSSKFKFGLPYKIQHEFMILKGQNRELKILESQNQAFVCPYFLTSSNLKLH